MPSIGLICTSIGFIIPAWIAKKRKQKKNTLLISSLTTSSILYHGTVHRYAHIFDLFIAHMVSINYLFSGTKNVLIHHNKYDALGLFLGFISTHTYYNKSRRINDMRQSRRAHIKVHIFAQLSLLMFVLGTSARNIVICPKYRIKNA